MVSIDKTILTTIRRYSFLDEQIAIIKVSHNNTQILQRIDCSEFSRFALTYIDDWITRSLISTVHLLHKPCRNTPYKPVPTCILRRLVAELIRTNRSCFTCGG